MDDAAAAYRRFQEEEYEERILQQIKERPCGTVARRRGRHASERLRASSPRRPLTRIVPSGARPLLRRSARPMARGRRAVERRRRRARRAGPKSTREARFIITSHPERGGRCLPAAGAAADGRAAAGARSRETARGPGLRRMLRDAAGRLRRDALRPRILRGMFAGGARDEPVLSARPRGVSGGFSEEAAPGLRRRDSRVSPHSGPRTIQVGALATPRLSRRSRRAPARGRFAPKPRRRRDFATSLAALRSPRLRLAGPMCRFELPPAFSAARGWHRATRRAPTVAADPFVPVLRRPPALAPVAPPRAAVGAAPRGSLRASFASLDQAHAESTAAVGRIAADVAEASSVADVLRARLRELRRSHAAARTLFAQPAEAVGG